MTPPIFGRVGLLGGIVISPCPLGPGLVSEEVKRAMIATSGGIVVERWPESARSQRNGIILVSNKGVQNDPLHRFMEVAVQRRGVDMRAYDGST